MGVWLLCCQGHELEARGPLEGSGLAGFWFRHRIYMPRLVRAHNVRLSGAVAELVRGSL